MTTRSRQQILGTEVIRTEPLHGGCIGDVLKAELSDGRQVVIKTGGSALDLEAWMLGYLKAHSDLLVPDVLESRSDMLVLEFIPGESRFSARAETHAAELLAALHSRTHSHFGLERDTLIGGLPQSNKPDKSWLAFFAEQRIMHMATLAHGEGKLPSAMLKRLECFCERIDRWLAEPKQPALLHGDAWTTNILAENDRITGFLDPAIYYGHPEIELAFTTLFGTFGESFFKRYHEINPIPDGFFELRRDLYNMYPLLVHVRLFGGSYLSGIECTLKKLGI